MRISFRDWFWEPQFRANNNLPVNDVDVIAIDGVKERFNFLAKVLANESFISRTPINKNGKHIS